MGSFPSFILSRGLDPTLTFPHATPCARWVAPPPLATQALNPGVLCCAVLCCFHGSEHGIVTGPSQWWHDNFGAVVVDAPVTVKVAQSPVDTVVLQSSLSFVDQAPIGAPSQLGDPDLQVSDSVADKAKSFKAAEFVAAEAFNTPR